MEVVRSVNLGFPEKNVFNLRENYARKTEGNLPMDSINDKLENQNNKLSKVISADQISEFFKIKGSIVDKLG